MTEPISSLFISFLGSNPGFAIEPLESMFYRAGLELACGDATRVHFAFRSLARGAPRNLPNATNAIEYDFLNSHRSNMEFLARYVSKHKIDLVQFFDMPVVHPVFRHLRRAGAHTILAYWGSPISGHQHWLKLLVKRFLIERSKSKLDGAIFESQAMADLGICGRGIPPEMTEVVHLGVDTTRFCPAPSEYVHQVFELPRERRVIIFSGHVIRRKGIHVLVEAAVDILSRRGRRDVVFILCGNRNGDEDEFQAMYAGRGIDEWIRFVGYRNDMPQLFASSFCGVIPSSGWDSFTLSSLEMAACGIPVVASRLHGLVEAVSDGDTGLLFEPGNAEALANTLESLLDNPQRAAQMGRNGRTRVERQFSLDDHFSRYLAVLKKRLSAHRTAACPTPHVGPSRASDEAKLDIPSRDFH